MDLSNSVSSVVFDGLSRGGDTMSLRAGLSQSSGLEQCSDKFCACFLNSYLISNVKYERYVGDISQATPMPVGSDTPLPVERVLKRLGQQIALARRRRSWTQRMLADRIEASLSTVRRMEEGFAGTAIEHIARAMHAFGDLDALAGLFETHKDMVGLTLMDETLPKRVRIRKSSSDPAGQ